MRIIIFYNSVFDLAKLKYGDYLLTFKKRMSPSLFQRYYTPPSLNYIKYIYK